MRSPTPDAAARMPERRQAGASFADRFWLVLGSIVGLVLVPAAGTALLPEGDTALPARGTASPDTTPRGGGGDAAEAGLAHSGRTAAQNPAAQSSAAALRTDDSQATTDTADTAAPRPEDIRALLASASAGGAGRTIPATADGDFDPNLLLRQRHLPEVHTALPTRPVDLPVVLPDGWPSLASVSAAGADRDTWGLFASFLIVSRDQDHMVETADGVLHMLINRGLKNGLTLVSSDDDGATWTVDTAFGADSFGTNRFATADIRLIDGGNVMILSYLDANNDVAFALYAYDLATGTWSVLQHSIVDSDPTGTNTLQSTVAMAPDGTILLAWTEETPEGGLRIVLQRSFDNGVTWTGSVLDQPDIDSGTARTIAAGDHAGIIYSNAEAMYWLTWTAAGDWDMEVIDAAGTVGRFHSHFSTITTGDDVVVVNIGTDLTLRILQFDGDTGIWSDPVSPLKEGVDVTSAQISVSDDTGYIYITYDDPDNLGRLYVIESRDGGETWTLEAVLQTPKGIVAEPTRFEAPEHFSGDLVINMQVMDPDNPNANGLYAQVVDVDGPETPIPPDVLLGQTDALVF